MQNNSAPVRPIEAGPWQIFVRLPRRLLRLLPLRRDHLRHRLSQDIDIFCPEENLIPIAARKLCGLLEREGVEVSVVRIFGSFWEAVLRELK